MVPGQIAAASATGRLGSHMKIAYFINQYPGISHSFIRREIQALERRGVDIRRFAIRPSKDEIFSREDKEERAKTRHIIAAPKLAILRAMIVQAATSPIRAAAAFRAALAMGWRSEAGLLRHLFYFCEALVLARWMSNERIRHVHAHFGTNPAAIAMLAARLIRGTYSFTVHGPEEFEKPDLISLRRKIKAAAFVAGVSRYGAGQLKRLSEPGDWPRIKIVRCGVEKEFYAGQTREAPRAPVFVCVGRLCAEKGQLDLVEAAALVAADHRDLRVALIGDGPMRGEIEAAIARRNLARHVELAGWKTPDEVRDAIVAARAFILPSYAEGLPVSIMEALGLRRPVISTYVAGIPELVADGVCGWLAPAGDVGAIAMAMRKAIAADAETLAAMGDEGRRRVMKMHDVDCEAGRLVACFAETTGEAA